MALLSPSGIKISLKTDHIYLRPRNIHLSLLVLSALVTDACRAFGLYLIVLLFPLHQFWSFTTLLPRVLLWCSTGSKPEEDSGSLPQQHDWYAYPQSFCRHQSASSPASHIFFSNPFQRECPWADRVLNSAKIAKFQNVNTYKLLREIFSCFWLRSPSLPPVRVCI